MIKHVIQAYVLTLLDFMTIRFKYLDQIKHRPIDFQSVTTGTEQGDKHFCAF
jgi:hypothetical protein